MQLRASTVIYYVNVFTLCSSVLEDNKSTYVANEPLSKVSGFISECPSDHYGRNCSSRCGHCYGKAACDIVTGKCEHGCEPGYMGDKCLQSKKHTNDSSY